MRYKIFHQLIRQARRHPLFFSLNLFGLALGIACAFVLFSYVRQEQSYDRGVPKSEEVYRIGTNFMDMGGFAISQEMLQPVLQDRCQAVAFATRFRGGSEVSFEVDQQIFPLEQLLYVDSNFFHVFPYEFIEGNAGTSLQHEGQIVLTENVAEQFFGSGPYLGKTLRLQEDNRPLSVSGIVRPFPGKSHLPATAWLSVASQLTEYRSWTSARFYNYVRLRKQAEKADLVRFLDQLKREEIHPQTEPNTSFEEWNASTRSVHFMVEPLTDVYLHSDLNMDLTPGGNPTQVWVLGIIGVFILLMAGVNYVNLSTAISSGRAKEVGIKKTMGAGRAQLISQFLGESIALSLFAGLLAGALSGLLLRLLEQINGEVLLTSILDKPSQWIILFGFSLLTGFAAGAYPAFYLSRFQPVWALKGAWVGHRKNILRNALVIFQFSIAAALMIGSLVVFRQLSFIQHSDKGFEHENVAVIRNFDALGAKKETFRSLIEQNSQVLSTSFNSRMPAGNQIWRATYRTEEMEEGLSLNGFPIDEHYLATMGMKLIAGRNFSGDLSTDTSNLILNESAVKALGLAQPIGAVLNDDRRVIGVVSDFNFESFRKQIAPIVFNYDTDAFKLAIKLKGTDLPAFAQHLEKSWDQLAGDESPQLYYLEDSLARLSEKEAVLSRAIGVFTVLTLLIACLGLFGLTTHTIVRRSKEIGIRKVLGATISQIVFLLSRDFLSLVLVAFVIGVPIAWWVTKMWLQDFAYRIELHWWIFVLPAIGGLLIAFFTLSYQSISAALNDPANVLKDE